METIDAISFFNKQLSLWHAAAQRYEQLKGVKTKRLLYGGGEVAVQFNPARIVSTGAKIDKAALLKRPCFLCKANRPAEQISATLLGRYELLVNPFPILPMHFTIPSTSHEPQSIASRYEDMMHIALELDGLIVFYNGPRCGASAPDHAHFQAGTLDAVPLAGRFQPTGKGIFPVNNHICPALAIVADTPAESAALFGNVYSALPVPDGDYEPMLNIIAFARGNHLVSIVIPRSKHRPDCYFADGEAQTLVSPGALDMGGLIITPREDDFHKMDADMAHGIIAECGITEKELENIINKASRP